MCAGPDFGSRVRDWGVRCRCERVRGVGPECEAGVCAAGVCGSGMSGRCAGPECEISVREAGVCGSSVRVVSAR